MGDGAFIFLYTNYRTFMETFTSDDSWMKKKKRKSKKSNFSTFFDILMKSTVSFFVPALIVCKYITISSSQFKELPHL